jgi:hypothetical protein
LQRRPSPDFRSKPPVTIFDGARAHRLLSLRLYAGTLEGDPDPTTACGGSQARLHLTSGYDRIPWVAQFQRYIFTPSRKPGEGSFCYFRCLPKND